MAKDPLNNDVGHSKPIEVASKTPPSRVPAVPDRNKFVSLVLVFGVAVVVLSLMAALAEVESRYYHSVDDAG